MQSAVRSPKPLSGRVFRAVGANVTEPSDDMAVFYAKAVAGVPWAIRFCPKIIIRHIAAIAAIAVGTGDCGGGANVIVGLELR